MRSLWRTLVALFAVLPKGAKPFYIWYSVLTAALSILDTAALALIVMTVTPLASDAPISLPLIGVVQPSATVWVVLVVCALFVLKGVLAVTLHWFATRRFARYDKGVSVAYVHMGGRIAVLMNLEVGAGFEKSAEVEELGRIE